MQDSRQPNIFNTNFVLDVCFMTSALLGQLKKQQQKQNQDIHATPLTKLFVSMMCSFVCKEGKVCNTAQSENLRMC